MITIRKAIRKDGQIISRLLKKKYSFKLLREAKQAFLNELKNGHHFRLAEDNGQVIGLISWRSQGALHHGVVELVRLAVVSDYAEPLQVKEELFNVMIAEADFYYRERGARLRKIFSMIHADSKHIRQFFIDKGMQQEAVLRNHYHSGKDELIFSLFFA